MQRLAIVLLATVSGSAQAAIVTLDTFQTEDSFTATKVGASDRSMPEFSAQGAFRHTRIEIFENLFGGRAEVRSGAGRGVVSFDAGIPGGVQFVYRDFSIAQRDFRQSKLFRVGFLANDNPLSLSISLQDGGGKADIRSLVFGEKQASEVTQFALLDFNGADLNFQDIRLINVTFVGEKPGAPDFTLSRIDAVPEPGTMVAVAAGLAALIARRRRNG